MVESIVEADPSSDVKSRLRAPTFELVLLAVCGLLGAGSFGTWQVVTFSAIFSVPPGFSSLGVERWGPGWMTLTLAIVAVISIALARATGAETARVVTASLFGASTVVTAIATAEYVVWYSGGPLASKSIGWGLWLCLVASVTGLVTSIAWHAGVARTSAEGLPPRRSAHAFRRDSMVLPLVIALAVVASFGSFGQWSSFHYPNLNRDRGFGIFPPSTTLETIAGIHRGGGQGWMTLLLAIFIAISTVLAVTLRARTGRIVAATLFGSMLIVVGFSMVEYLTSYPSLLWYPEFPIVSSTSIGSGLWMCLGAAVAGLGLSVAWNYERTS